MHSTPVTRPRNTLLERLARGEVAGMMSVRVSRGPVVAQVALAAGFDALYVDMEHSTVSADDAGHICMACVGNGVTPLVRIPAMEPAHVGRLLDAGAMGIIAPHVSTPEQAQALVDLCRFPPMGRRSSVALLPHFGYRAVPSAQVAEWMNASTALIVMIEDAIGLAAADAIAAVDGVDVLLVGCSDLAADLGASGAGADVAIDGAIAQVVEACRRHGKTAGVGGLAHRRERLQHAVQLGARLVSLGTDLSFLIDGAGRQAAIARDLARVT